MKKITTNYRKEATQKQKDSFSCRVQGKESRKKYKQISGRGINFKA
jgi:hypothetical protein